MALNLDQLRQSLEHAAGAGGRRVVDEQVQDAEAELTRGRELQRPGPGLAELAPDAPGPGGQVDVAGVLHGAAERMADDGARVALGLKR